MNGLRKKLIESDIFSHISTAKYMPRWVVLCLDIIICIISYYIATYFAIKIYDIPTHSLAVETRMVLIIFFQFIWFWVFHTYSGIIRYSTIVDISKIGFSLLANALTIVVLQYVILSLLHVHYFLLMRIVFYVLTSYVLLICMRLCVKGLYELLMMSTMNIQPVAYYGTSHTGLSVPSSILLDKNSAYKIKVYIEDNNQSRSLRGVKVVSGIDKKILISSLQKAYIKTIIFSSHKLKEMNLQHDLDLFIEAGFKLLSVPEVTEINSQETQTQTSVHSIQIEDLLNRKPIMMDKVPIRNAIEGKVIMVTGAAGSIGSEIVNQVIQYQPKLLILFDNAETPMHNMHLKLSNLKTNVPFVLCIGDMRNRDRVESIISMYQPNTIYHAAAYKHVPLMEMNPSESILANVMGTRNVADMAVKYNVDSFVMISTDKAVRPTNVMGASKRIAEVYVQSLHKKLKDSNASHITKFSTTRFGNVLGSNGSVIPLFKEQIEKGGPVTVTDPNIIRYFMTIPEACQLVLEAGTMGDGGEIFIFDMGEPTKIVNLAKKMILLSGYKPDIDIKIKFTGLRPGEKLYEELLNDSEKTKPTYHSKIMIADINVFEYDHVVKCISKMIEYSVQSKNYLVVKCMKELLGDFKSNNSKYEAIDLELAKIENK